MLHTFTLVLLTIAAVTQQPAPPTPLTPSGTRIRIAPLGDGRFRFTEQTAQGGGDWSAEDVTTYRPIK